MSDKKQHWQNIYSEKSHLEVSWYQQEPKISLDLILHSEVGKDEAIIDVGGGASLLVDKLFEKAYTNLSVLDISEKALAKAKQRLGNSAKNINWFETDITEFTPSYQFSVWHDRAVFHFLTDESDKKKYVHLLKKSLKPGGHLIIAAFAIGGPKECSGLEVIQYDTSKLLAELGEGFLLLEEKDEIHITPGNKNQNFTYFHFIKI